MDNLDLAYNWMETSLLQVLNTAAPLKKIQQRRRHRKWVSTDTKKLMELRDISREKARKEKYQN